MKTRNGFVSNSSSSSFIVAVPNETKVCECCKRDNHWMIQCVQKYIQTLTVNDNKLVTHTGADELKDYHKEELDALVKSKTYCEGQLAIIDELENDTKLFENYERLKKQLDKSAFDSIKQESQIYSGTPTEKAKSVLKKRRETIIKHLESYDKKVEDIKNIIKKLKEYINKDYTVYSFTLDNWATDAEKALKTMMAEKVIETIWSSHNS